jgi:4-amino-4-deoxy-L-arabinose transferase-like glycosyltransferase
MMTGTRVGVAVMAAGVILIIIGALDVGRDDLIHTVATTLVVLGAVILSVATEATDQAREDGEPLRRVGGAAKAD